MIEENNLSSDNFLKNIAKLNDISNRELAQYFHYRQEIINGLKDLDDNNCTQEELFHNLFMKKEIYQILKNQIIHRTIVIYGF